MNKNHPLDGTGISRLKLEKIIGKDYFDKIQILTDRDFQYLNNDLERLDKNKIKIFWVHSTPSQNEYVSKIMNINPYPLSNMGWTKFDKIIFISYHQMENWIKKYNIDRSYCKVIKYAIDPIKIQEKPKDKIVLIHHPNPNRGLSILVNVFEKLSNEYSNIELKVHSSWKIYENQNHSLLKESSDWQKNYEKSDLYKRLEKHPKINNIGYISNDKIRESLATSHIFVHPSTMEETFCMSLLEAMSAGCLCVHSSLGSLPEVSSNWTMMYDYYENNSLHEIQLYKTLKKAIDNVNTKKTQNHVKKQKDYIDYLFNWEVRSQEWMDFLQSEDLYIKKNKKTLSLSY